MTINALKRIHAIKSGFYILLIFSVTLVFGLTTLYELEEIEFEEEKTERFMLQNKYAVVEAAILDGYSEAQEQGQEISKEIITTTSEAYKDDIGSLRHDLDTIDHAQDTRLTEVLREAVKGKYINGIENDNNDPFIATQNAIVSDLSLNCSAEFGRTRTYTEEIEQAGGNGHFNKVLARNTLFNIGNQVKDKNIWIYLDVPEDKPYYDDLFGLLDVDEYKLRELFYKYDGDLTIYQYPEFIYSNYIYKKEDLIGRPLVDANGFRHPDSQILIINSGFNVYDIIMSSTALKSGLDAVEEHYFDDILLLDTRKDRAYLRFFIMLAASIFVVVVIALNNNLRKQTK